MRRMISTIIMTLFIIGLLAGSAVAGIGDENWYGNDDDAVPPGTGVEEDKGNTDNANSATGKTDFNRQRNWLL